MINVNITIRGLDEAVFRRFKAKAIEEGMRLGEAVTQAMEIWIKRRRAKGRASLLEMEPLDWGAGTERLSIEIDRVLYGGRG